MPEKYSYLDFALETLEASREPLIYQDIWALGKEKGFSLKLSTKGKTPWASLGSYLFVDVRDNPETKFIKVGKNPARFYLKYREAELSKNIENELNEKELKSAPIVKVKDWNERDLHQIFAYFAYANTEFNKGKAIYTKTIFHELSKKTGYNEWVHPDMVGFYIPIEDWNEKLIEFNKISDSNSIILYSFELKKAINKSNYREYFFQAVSNSSWANEGYLVAAAVRQDDDLLSELERLSNSFGIGIIQLDLEDIAASRVLFQAKHKVSLDWELMNKLCSQNSNFEDFIEDISKDYTVKRITKDKYESIKTEKEITDNIKKMIKGQK